MFLLRPSRRTGAIVEYALAVAAERTGIQVHGFCAMSSHVHVICSDPDARLPEFAHAFHLLVAKAMNVSYGRFENFWSSEPYSAVRLETPDDAVAKLVYVAANPVSAGLVPRAREWPGAAGGPDDYGRQRAVPRPTGYFDEDGSMPEVATLALVRPPGFDGEDDAAFARRFGDLAREREREVAREMAAQGREFLGVRGVLRQSPTARAASVEPRFGVNPRIAARDRWRRIESLQRLRAFLDAYRDALDRWRAGARDVVFPSGTYLWRVRFAVACAPA